MKTNVRAIILEALHSFYDAYQVRGGRPSSQRRADSRQHSADRGRSGLTRGSRGPYYRPACPRVGDEQEWFVRALWLQAGLAASHGGNGGREFLTVGPEACT